MAEDFSPEIMQGILQFIAENGARDQGTPLAKVLENQRRSTNIEDRRGNTRQARRVMEEEAIRSEVDDNVSRELARENEYAFPLPPRRPNDYGGTDQ